jgi:hypothetical protein
MRKILSLFAPVLLAASFAASTGPALAADEVPAAAEAPANAYDELFAALEQSVDIGQMKEQVLGSLMTALQNEIPELALIEEAEPGFLEKLRGDLRPIMSDYSDRVRREYRPRMTEVLSGALTPAEATQVAAFYRSPLGRKLMMGASENYAFADTAGEALKNPDADINSEALEKDFRRMGVQAYLGLTAEERKQLNSVATEYPALTKFVANQSAVMAVRVQMENEELNPEEEARLQNVIESAFGSLEPKN